ncbi:MAG: alpha/beta hydrolase fold domain-containing protein [Cetobacterium sp.]|uniref:alpha/beta hydrolase n=1 Tax=unclassified Cetobacterium TaxID=2630983 RepID=UPI001E383AFE|nr:MULTISPECIES: alpha/beta hydrolase [unclassified Cetobacterium]
MNVKKILIILMVTFFTKLMGFQSEEIDVLLQKPKIDMLSDITYSQPGNLNLKLDLLKSEIKEKQPLLIFITGGGFFASPKNNYIQQRLAIAEAGYIVASIEYRVIPQGKFPDPLIDIKAAIRYLKANADKFGIDKERVAVMGESAGGYLASLAGTTVKRKEFEIGENLEENSDIQAVINIYGLSDLTQVGSDYSKEVQENHNSPSAPQAILINGMSIFGNGGSVNSNLEAAKKANPITYISKNTPSFLLMHGDKDTLVSPSQTDLLYQELKKNKIDAKRYVVKNAGHGDIYWSQSEITELIIKFLNEKLK